jgi:FtsP/CotA-like multicopper oxidase with cupredoxin domain
VGWYKVLGDDGDQRSALSLARTPGGGGVRLAGELVGTIDFGSGPESSVGLDDGFVARYAANGALLWTRLFSGPARQEVQGVTVHPLDGTIIAAGTFEGTMEVDGAVFEATPSGVADATDGFVVRLDADGNYLEGRAFGGSGKEGFTSASAAAGYIAVGGGGDSSSIDLGQGGLTGSDGDGLAAVFQPELDAIWTRRIAGSYRQHVNRIGVDPATTNFAFAGLLEGTVTLGCGAIAAQYGGFLALLAGADGACIASRGFDGLSSPAAVHFDARGDVLLAGPFHDTTDVGPTATSSAGEDDGIIVKLDGALAPLELPHRFARRRQRRRPGARLELPRARAGPFSRDRGLRGLPAARERRGSRPIPRQAAPMTHALALRRDCDEKPHMRRTVTVAAMAGAIGCGAEEASQPRQPDGFADGVALATVVDEDPDPAVLEVTLVARLSDLSFVPGTTTAAWTYNGGVPGPLLRLRAGERLVVHFKNELPEPTSVHWHGVRVPNRMDGAPPHTQDPVNPGESFDYDFVVPDPGLFWYHPHVSSAAQLGFGLYGALLVEPAEPEPAGLGDEVVLVLSDIALDEETGALLPPDQSGDIATLFGREGAVLLANGRVRPTLRAQSGLRQRWRIVNAAKSRYYQLALPGHDFDRIGGDTGLLAEPERKSALLLMPGSRADVTVVPTGAPGSVATLTWLPYDRGYGTADFRDPAPVLDVAIEGDTVATPALPALGGAVEALDLAGATPIDIRLTQATDAEGNLVLGINGVPFGQGPPIPARVGETQLWTLDNEMSWAHPFHLHGFFFQQLDDEGAPIHEWLDTTHVPQKGRTRFVVRYDERIGMWMFHCHILDHSDAGMMGMVRLLP